MVTRRSFVVARPVHVPSCRALFALLTRAAHLSWLVYLVIAGFMLLPGLLIGPSLDAAVFSTVGWRLTQGDQLYADVWDHKPPGVYAPSMIAHALTASPQMAWVVTWALTVICAAATAAVIQRMLQVRGVGWPAYLAAALGAMVLGTYLLTLGGGLGESYAVLPAVISLALVAGRPSNRSVWLLSGLAVGAATVISLQAITVVAGLAVLGVFAAPRRLVMARAAMVAAGMLIVGAMAVGGLAWSGTVPDALDALLAYNGAYRAAVSSASTGASRGSVLLPWVFLCLLPLVVPGVTAVLAARRDATNRHLILACGAWIVAGVAAVAVQGRLYGHYALPIVVPLAIASGIGLNDMATNLRGRGVTLQLAPAMVAVGLALIVGAAGAQMEQRWIRTSNAKVADMAPRLEQLTEADDSIFIWGNEPRLYEVSRRAPGLPYTYLYPLLTRGYITPELIDGLVAELDDEPPAVIVDAGSDQPGEPGMPPLLIERPVATDGRDYDILDPLRAYVAQHYEERETVSGWVIYTLRRAS